MTYILNGSSFNFNESTGELISLTSPDGRELITRGAGLFDLAVPVKYDYEILRMAPNYMNAGAVSFDFTNGTLTVKYLSLGLNLIPREEIPQIKGGVGRAAHTFRMPRRQIGFHEAVCRKQLRHRGQAGGLPRFQWA